VRRGNNQQAGKKENKSLHFSNLGVGGTPLDRPCGENHRLTENRNHCIASPASSIRCRLALRMGILP
jgi:hypothetical protein